MYCLAKQCWLISCTGHLLRNTDTLLPPAKRITKPLFRTLLVAYTKDLACCESAMTERTASNVKKPTATSFACEACSPNNQKGARARSRAVWKLSVSKKGPLFPMASEDWHSHFTAVSSLHDSIRSGLRRPSQDPPPSTGTGLR